jgi:hypothetical protein
MDAYEELEIMVHCLADESKNFMLNEQRELKGRRFWEYFAAQLRNWDPGARHATNA